MKMITKVLTHFERMGHRPEMALWTGWDARRRVWHAEVRCDGDVEPVKPLGWVEEIKGAGFTPDEALAELEIRCSRFVSVNSL